MRRSCRSRRATPCPLWYHFGPQGETRYLTDQIGAIVDSYLYTAYGEPVASTGADRNPFQYGGQVGYYTGPGAGLVLCGARWYNPYTARWMTRDPIGYDGGENLYGYCDGDPVGGLDPDGLTDWETVDQVTDWTLTGAGFLIGGIGGGISGAGGGDARAPIRGYDLRCCISGPCGRGCWGPRWARDRGTDHRRPPVRCGNSAKQLTRRRGVRKWRRQLVVDRADRGRKGANG